MNRATFWDEISGWFLGAPSSPGPFVLLLKEAHIARHPVGANFGRGCDEALLRKKLQERLPKPPSANSGKNLPLPHGGWPWTCNCAQPVESTIGPIRITQLIPREFSGVTEEKFITPINSLRLFWCSFLRGTTQEGVTLPGNYAKFEWCSFPVLMFHSRNSLVTRSLFRETPVAQPLSHCVFLWYRRLSLLNPHFFP